MDKEMRERLAQMDEEKRDRIKRLPKAELHLHFEGAAPPEFIRALAREKNVDLSRIFREDGSYAYRDFGHFLQVYEAACSVLQGPEDFARLCTAILEQSAANDVVYCETFLSPDFCGGGDLAAWRDYLAAIEEAASQAEARYGIILRAIVTPIRHFGPERARAPALCAAETAGEFIVGLGLGGDENTGKQGDFAWAFDCAREAGLCLTSHAGEWRGPSEVREAVEDLGVTRIGHGVRAIDDPALLDLLIERDVTLEVCPGSNVFLGVAPSLEAHPVERLRRHGVAISISTDDPPFFHTNMRREYDDLARVFGWDEEIFAQIHAQSVKAAFCDEKTRAIIAKKLGVL